MSRDRHRTLTLAVMIIAPVVALGASSLPLASAATHRRALHLADGATYAGAVRFNSHPPSSEAFRLHLAKNARTMSLVGAFEWAWWAGLGGSCAPQNLGYGNYLIASKQYRKTHPYRGGPGAQAPPSIKVHGDQFAGSERLDGGRLRIAGAFTGTGRSASGTLRFTSCSRTLVLHFTLKAR